MHLERPSSGSHIDHIRRSGTPAGQVPATAIAAVKETVSPTGSVWCVWNVVDTPGDRIRRAPQEMKGGAPAGGLSVATTGHIGTFQQMAELMSG